MFLFPVSLERWRDNAWRQSGERFREGRDKIKSFVHFVHDTRKIRAVICMWLMIVDLNYGQGDISIICCFVPVVKLEWKLNQTDWHNPIMYERKVPKKLKLQWLLLEISMYDKIKQNERLRQYQKANWYFPKRWS